MTRTGVASWTPKELIVRASQQELEAFLLSFKARYVLLVADPSGDLQAGLGMTHDEHAVFCTETFEQSESQPTPGINLHRASPLRASALPISPDVLKMPCHVVALHATAESGPLCRLTVGRSPDNDIVLCHRTISKLHGWIEIDSERQLFLRDANSTNHTFVNGTQVVGHVEVHPGCCIRFGAVESFIYRTQSLWQQLHL